jgi:UDP-GlcNAc:undecaprenyl-phosphate GlcNAc-1-phosphate transferase
MLEVAGFSDRVTLLMIVCASVLFAAAGLLGHFLQISEPVMFYSFLAMFGFYLIFIKLGWRVLRGKADESKF